MEFIQVSKRAMLISLLFCVLYLTVASAQSLPIDKLTPPLPTKTERMIADAVSYAPVGILLVLDTRASLQAPDRVHALELQGARLFTTWGLGTIVKMAVARERPCSPSCGIDSANSSFPSLHTAFAFSTVGGPRLSISIPLSIGTGGLRIAAGKHYLTDVAAGAVLGLVESRLREVK